MKKRINALKSSRYIKTVFLIITMLMVSTGAFCQDIYGYVNDETGNAVPNADVRLMENNKAVLLGYAVTDSTGMFRIEDISRDSISFSYGKKTNMKDRVQKSGIPDTAIVE